MPTELNDRQKDGARSLLAISDVAGGDWPEKARKAIVAVHSTTSSQDHSAPTKLLADIGGLLARMAGPISSSLSLPPFPKLHNSGPNGVDAGFKPPQGTQQRVHQTFRASNNAGLTASKPEPSGAHLPEARSSQLLFVLVILGPESRSQGQNTAGAC
jgi:hypothetical protein